MRAEQAAQASQKRVAMLDSEASSALAEYRQANAEIGGLKAYNDQLAEQVKSQETEMATMTRQLVRNRNHLARSVADDAEDGRDAR